MLARLNVELMLSRDDGPAGQAAEEIAEADPDATGLAPALTRGRAPELHGEEGLSAPQPVPPGREPVAGGERPEMARVDADLLDQMLNISGEASIARARLEQQLGSFDFNLGELSRTVTRLKEQLRSLEIETEAQILHKHEDEGAHRSEFDPLELDRYSSIQQYSRALAETANDVASIQQLLESLAKDTQTLLQQQARTITELQNGLMRTRMVPFQRHVQRLGPHRAPGGRRDRQARRARRRGRLRGARPAGARAHAAAVRAHAAQCRGARHRRPRGARAPRQARHRTHSPRAAS